MLGYVSKWVKQTLVILGVLLGLSPIAFAQTNLERGTYTLTNNVMHDNPVGQGMARSYTEEQTGLVVSKDGLWLTLGFNNTQYMGEFTIKVNGSQVSYEVISSSNNIKRLKFKIPSLEVAVSVGMYVVPMNTDVEYTVTLNQSSLKLIEKEEVEEVKPEEPVAKPEGSTSNTTQIENNTANNNQTVTKPSTSTGVGTGSSTQSGTSSQAKPEQSTGAQNNIESAGNAAELQTEAQTKVEEDVAPIEVVETSEEGMQEEIEAETEETSSKEDELKDVEVEMNSEAESEQEWIEEVAQEQSNKGNIAGINAIIIIVIAVAAGLYYWYFKMRK